MTLETVNAYRIALTHFSFQLCRPYFKDRTYMSLNSTFTDDIQLQTDRFIPIHDAAIVRNLGLRPPMMVHPAFRQGQTSLEDTSSSGTPSSISSSSSSSDSMFSDDDTRRSGVLLPPPLPGRSSCSSSPNDATTDQLGNVRQAHGEVGISASVNSEQAQKLPGESDRPDWPDSGLHGSILVSGGRVDLSVATPRSVLPRKASPFGRSDSTASSIASNEVPVDGGVALTEEAVENEVPDIVTEEAVDNPLSDIMSQA